MEQPAVKTPRGVYAKTAKQRADILATALHYFAQHGYHGASMREIARQAGLSQAGLRYHFASKADLLTSVLESRDLLTRSTATAAMDRARDPLVGMTSVIADNTTQRPLVQMFAVVSAEATDVDHPAHDYFRRRTQRVIGLMRASLEQAREQGLVRADLDLDQAARQCQALMYGLQAQWLFDPTIDMVAVFEQFLDGFRPRDGSG